MNKYTIAMLLSNIAAFLFGWFICCIFSDKVESWSLKENEQLKDKNIELLNSLGHYTTLVFKERMENDILTKIIVNAAYNKEKPVEVIYDLIKNPKIAEKLESIFKEASKQQEKQE